MTVYGGYRARTRLIVSLSPGIHIRKLQKLLGASFSTTRYHVESLERSGEIVRSKYGRYDRLYPKGMVETMKEVYAVLQSRTARTILQTLVESNSHKLTNGDLAELTRLPRSTVSECLARLGKASLTSRTLTMQGRIEFEVRDRENVLLLLSGFQENVLSLATDRFIELWEL